MVEDLTKIVFVGYPYDGLGEIKAILSADCQIDDEYLDDAFRSATQKAVWHVTDNRPFRTPTDGSIPTGNTNAQVSEYVASLIYDRAIAYQGDTGLTTRLWEWQGMNNRNQHLLDTGFNVNVTQPVVTTGKLVITKTIEGDVTEEEANGALQFTVTAPDGTTANYTLADFTLANGKYTLEIDDAQAGDYTVEETAYDIDGNSVTVTCSVDGAAATEATQGTATLLAEGTATFDFKDSYVKDPVKPATGKLVITKTIEGDVTEEEANGALQFTVTAPDGTTTNYTLADFTLANGKYTLEIDDAQAGDYTVEETAYDIDGNSVTVTCSVNGATASKGTKGTATVKADGTATVDFKDSYTKKEDIDGGNGSNDKPTTPSDDGDKDKPTTPSDDGKDNGGDKTTGSDKDNGGSTATTDGDNSKLTKSSTSKDDSSSDAKTKASDKKTNPTTGDSAMMSLAAMAVLLVSGGVILVSNNKKKAYQPKHLKR